MMARKYTEAKKRSNNKYESTKLDHIHLRLPKGKKAMLQDHAGSRGESVNGFVSRAIDEAIERDNRTD